MKKKDVFKFVKNYELFKELEGFEFIKNNSRNYDLFKSEMDSLEKALNTNKKFNEYQEKGNELLIKHSVKDESGEVISNELPDGRVSYNIEDKTEFNKNMTKLNIQYKDAIATQEKNMIKFNEAMEEEITGNYRMIKEDDIPANINQIQMGLVRPFIEWND